MSTDHNRIKVADLETNEPNKTLITNENGELEFIDANLKADINSPVFTGTPEAPIPTTENGIVNKSYADSLIAGLLNDRGSYDASVNLFPNVGGSGSAGGIKKGDLWYVSVAGTLGSKTVNVGDSFRSLVNAPGQTAANWSILEANIGYVPANDTEVIHKSGNETFFGIKSAINTGITSINGLSLTNNGAADTNSMSISNTNTGNGITIGNYGSVPSAGLNIVNSGTGRGIYISNLNGTGNVVVNTSTGIAYLAVNNSTGTASHISNGSSGVGLSLNSETASTGDLLRIMKNNTIVTKADSNGILTTTTQTVGDNSSKIATTAFVLANSVQGSGTMDYISKWSTTTGRLVNSRISDTGTNISIPSFAPPTPNSENIGTSSLYYNQAFIQTGFINNVNSNITKTNSLTIGMSNTSGLINFVRASDGAIQGGVGYAASNNSSEVRLTSNGGGAFITFYAAGGEGFRLSPNRNLLLGTATDNGYKLDVNGPMRGASTLTLGATGISGSLLIARSNDGSPVCNYGFPSITEIYEVRATHSGGGGYFTWMTNSNAAVTEKMRLSNVGNLLIGTQTDSTLFKFDVNGNVRMSGTVNTQSIIPMSNAIYTLGNSINIWNEMFAITATLDNVKVRSSAGINFTASNGTVHGRMFASGNWLFQNGGNYTDAGYKIDITGASRLNGTIAIADPVSSAGTYDILTKNSSGIIEKIPASVLPSSGAYTPTVSASSNVTSSNVVLSKWTKTNNTYSVRINFGVSGVTTAGTVSTLTINLPYDRANASALSLGSGTIGSGGNRIYPVMAISHSASTVTFYFTQSVSEIAGGTVILMYDIFD